MKEGDVAKFSQLAQTYRKVAAEGAHTFYNGSLKDDILADLRDIGKTTPVERDSVFLLACHEFT